MMTHQFLVAQRRSVLSRKALLMSCASAVLAAAALAPQSAGAQAFRGSITGTTGSVTRTAPSSSTTSGTIETITIGSSTATINWSPSNQQQGGGTLDFLPSGNTATFTSTPGVTDYTVLNRILPATGQTIALNGHVISTLQGTSTTGGNVWFYSPGGIVVGASAVFDVGGLLLTANDVTNLSTSGSGFSASFSAPSGSTSSIQVMNGAKINALQQNSYVALVAPRVEQGGTVRVNGSAAYAAGEQLNMTMNQGLFDIQVDVGTTDPNGIVHTGETSGPANATAADNHTIYMVAVPKNQAMTMLLGGKVGYDDAVSASVKNGEIILSSGWGVHDSDGSGQYYPVNSGLSSNLEIGPGTYTSDVDGLGQGTLAAVADTGDTTFTGNLTLNSWGGASPASSLAASDGHQLSVAGNVSLLSSQSNDALSSIDASAGGKVTIGGSATLDSWNGTDGGTSSLIANGGSITIAGPANLYAAGSADPTSSDSAGLDSTGGTASVSALGDGGSISTGDLLIDADGFAQANNGTGVGGNGYGGVALIDAEDGATISVNGNLTAYAGGAGGNAGSNGGLGQGGMTDLLVNGGSITVSGNAGLYANATGGGGAGQGGNATGGSAEFSVTGGSATIGSDITVQADATAGNASAGTGGYAYRGSAAVDAYDGSITAGDLTMSANATGGSGWVAGGAEAGRLTLAAQSDDPGSPASIILHDVTMTANGTIGSGAPDEANGGFGSIDVDGSSGSIIANSLTAQANGSNFGGAITLQSDDGGGSIGALQFGSVNAQANAGDWAGAITVSASGGSTVDLGEASLQTSGAFSGGISLFAGGCACYGEAGSAKMAALPAGGGIGATDLTLDTSGTIYAYLSNGADVSVTGALQGSAGQSIHLYDEGTGGAIRAHSIDLSAITIDGNAHLVADTIDLTAASDVSVGDADASTSATFTAADVAEFDGTLNSPTITVTSDGIDIADGASLGVAGTTKLITINALSDGEPIIIGGDGSQAGEGQYVLDPAGDIRTAALVINAPGAQGSPAAVQVYDTQIDGSGTSGGGIGKVTLNTDGTVFIDGQVDFTNAGATDALTINAGHAIEVNTDLGGIQITNSTGALAGTLTLNADNIWVGNQSLLTQLEADPNFAGRDAALASSSGTPNQNGFVRAGTIVAGVADSFLVQNSGTAQLFAGIDTGDGGLSIDSTGTAPAVVIAYGRQTDSNGTVITNEDFLASVALSGTGFTNDSAVNGCSIGEVCGVTYTIDISSFLGPLEEADAGDGDDKKKDKNKDDNGDGSNVDPSMRLINTTPINVDHTIDEPVTSGGDAVMSGSTN